MPELMDTAMPRRRKVTNIDNTRTSYKNMANDMVQQYAFSKQNGGWVGCVTKLKSSHYSSTYKRLCEKRNQQRSNQIKSQKSIENTHHHRSSLSTYMEELCLGSQASQCEDDSDSYNSESCTSEEVGDVEELLNLKPNIANPFSDYKLTKQLSVWKAPETQPKLRSWFEKPSNDKFASFTSPAALVQRLQKLLDDKDKQIHILQKQLVKVHTESSKLVQEMDKRRRPNAALLHREHRLMKDQLERCLRENALLQGLHRQSSNSVIRRMREKEMLDTLYSRNHQQRARSAPLTVTSITSGRLQRGKMRAKSAQIND